ncbi:MAG: MBL fold metallo-hydrolase [Rubrobacter sp.]|jgi:glyoxylase-like metal-dependent hydrolase (beta-lactamase superfamily II)|nr:MBL fold metallo-hydrolase [Rubrobacter sp.]
MAELTRQVAEGVHRYADGLVNWYVIEEGEELTLVDAGWPRSWPRVERAISDLGRSLGDVRAVVLTHGHPDHIGAAERVRRECGATVWAYREEVSRVRGEAKGSSPFALVPALLTQLWRPTALGFVLHATGRGFLTPSWPTEVVPFEAEGGRIDVPGRPRPVKTPGHTGGHVSFVLEESGVLLAGDALLTLDPLTRAEGPTAPPDALNSSPGQVRESLEALAQLEAATLLPGHGEPWSGDVAEAAARAREGAGEV